MRLALALILALLLGGVAAGAGAPPGIAFGKWLAAEWRVGAAEETIVALKVRGLYVNGRLREYTLGEPHAVSDRLFVVRRAYRLNDLLPGEKSAVPRWAWQRAGWLLVDRSTGNVTQLRLPEFDAFHSTASWFRDYVAYCGVSENGGKLFAVVAQLGRRKPVLRKDLGPSKGGDLPDAECSAPRWQRGPVRVTFAPAGGEKLTFEVRGHAAEPVTEEETLE
ncbi:MAG: hypothetical protein ACRD2R_09575 [Terriglobales bacterium]